MPCTCDHSDDGNVSSTVSLLPAINVDETAALNALATPDPKSVFRPRHRSNCDEARQDVAGSCGVYSEEDDSELVLIIPFINNIKLHSIVVQCSGSTAPVSCRLFINRQDLDCSNINDVSPIESVNLCEDIHGVIPHAVKLSKFQNVSTLIMHFQKSVGEEQTCIEWIELRGEITNSKRMPILNVVYETTPQIKDHTDVKKSSMNSFMIE